MHSPLKTPNQTNLTEEIKLARIHKPFLPQMIGRVETNLFHLAFPELIILLEVDMQAVDIHGNVVGDLLNDPTAPSSFLFALCFVAFL